MNYKISEDLVSIASQILHLTPLHFHNLLSTHFHFHYVEAEHLIELQGALPQK